MRLIQFQAVPDGAVYTVRVQRRAVPYRRPVATADKTSKCGLYLTDTVWEKLQLEVIRKRTNVSAVAGELLERNLPRLRIEREA